VRRSEQLPSSELCYRILIDEIPKDDSGPASGVDIRLRYSVPLFVLPADDRAAPVLAWSVFKKMAIGCCGSATAAPSAHRSARWN
jgi:fimbrial chaperone protein